VKETEEVWFTLDDIKPSDNQDRLFCIAVDSPEKQFLIGEMGVPTHNTEAGKEEDSMKGEAQMIISSIARLGRAAGVHLVLATQRPDAKLIPGELKANLGVRINCGRTNSTASSMILDSGEGTRVKANPRGRLYLGIYGKGNHGQGFFAQQDWIDQELAKLGKNPDGTPLNSGKKQKRVMDIEDFSQFENASLDDITGVDNKSKLEELRRQDEEEDEDWEDDDIESNNDDDEIEKENEDFEVVKHEGFGELKFSKGGKKKRFTNPIDSWTEDMDEIVKLNWGEEN